MRKVFRLKVILITLACVVGVAILLPAAYFLFVLGVGMGLGDNPGWMPPATYSGSAPPQWTPDDSEIVFAHGGSSFAAMSDGSSLRLIHGEDGEDDLHYSPALSPDGSTLAYQKLTNDGFYSLFMDNSSWQIATSRLDGSDERVLTSDLYLIPRIPVAPSWSPDGRRIMFTSDREIHTMAPDGSDMRLVKGLDTMVPEYGYVRLALTDMMPLSWSPGGQRIGFIGTDNGNSPVTSYILGADGVAMQKIREWGGCTRMVPRRQSFGLCGICSGSSHEVGHLRCAPVHLQSRWLRPERGGCIAQGEGGDVGQVCRVVSGWFGTTVRPIRRQCGRFSAAHPAPAGDWLQAIDRPSYWPVTQ